MDWTQIILALIAILATGFAIKIAITKNTSIRKVVQNNNTAKGDIVAGDKTTNNINK
jgi:hypothetical protein